jgi:hypothetical protein
MYTIAQWTEIYSPLYIYIDVYIVHVVYSTDNEIYFLIFIVYMYISIE